MEKLSSSSKATTEDKGKQGEGKVGGSSLADAAGGPAPAQPWWVPIDDNRVHRTDKKLGGVQVKVGTSLAMDRLPVAQAAIKHVNTKILTLGAGNQAADVLHTRNRSRKNNENLRIGLRPSKWKTGKTEDVKTRFARTTLLGKQFNAASCNDFSAITMDHLNKTTRGLQVNECSNQSHSFVVIGDMHTQGKETARDWVVADPWPVNPQACTYDDFALANSNDDGRMILPIIKESFVTDGKDASESVGNDYQGTDEREDKEASKADTRESMVDRAASGASPDEADLWDARQTIGGNFAGAVNPILYVDAGADKKQMIEAKKQLLRDIKESSHLKNKKISKSETKAIVRAMADGAKRREAEQKKVAGYDSNKAPLATATPTTNAAEKHEGQGEAELDRMLADLDRLVAEHLADQGEQDDAATD